MKKNDGGVIDAEFEESAQRPCTGTVEIPIESIDGASSVASLRIRGTGQDLIELEFDGKKLVLSGTQMVQAVHALNVLNPASLHMHGPFMPPPMPIPQGPFPREPGPFRRR